MDTQPFSAPLTARQAEMLGHIQSYSAARGYPPTLRDLCTLMGIRSTNGVNDHLSALERKGYLRREPMKSRGLQIVATIHHATPSPCDADCCCACHNPAPEAT